MFIKLETKSETEKAIQLPNGAWIPKKALNNKGLIDNYYQVEGWWLQACMNTRYTKETGDKLRGLHPLVIKRLPEDVNKKYMDYLSGGLQGNFHMYDSDDRHLQEFGFNGW